MLDKRENLAYFILGIGLIAVYFYPYILTFSSLGFHEIPPLFDSDLYLYLNISNLNLDPNGNIISSWYGGTMPAGELAYNKFNLSFAILHFFYMLSGSSWTIALLLWTAFWVIFIYISALWLFKLIAGKKKLAFLIIFTLLFLFLFRVPELKNILSLWLNLPDISEDIKVNLTYSRAFFPQAAVAYLFLYTIFQIKVLEKKDYIIGWLILCLLQFLALKTFPYLLMIAALMTFLVLIILLISDRKLIPWKHVIWYGILCIVIDLGYLILTGSSTSPSFKVSAIDFDLSKATVLYGKSLILMTFLTAIIVMIRNKNAYHIKVSILALGLSSILLTLSHIVFSSAFQIENHIYYFSQTIISIQIFYILVQLFQNIRLEGAIKTIFITLSVFLFAHGILAAHSHFVRYYDHNSKIFEISSFLKNENLDKNSLVVTPAHMPSSLSPISYSLVNDFQILYHPDAHFLSTKETDTVNVHKLRQAIYLYFLGKDVNWIDQTWSNSTHFLVQEEFTIPALRLLLRDKNRESFLVRQKSQMTDFFEKVTNHDNDIETFFKQYNKIVVVDYKEQPIFKQDRLDDYMNNQGEKVSKNFTYKMFRGKP